MSAPKFTQGPWCVAGPFKEPGNGFGSQFEVNANPVSTRVAVCVYTRGDQEAKATAEADAVLIAAAPELVAEMERQLFSAKVLKGFIQGLGGKSDPDVLGLLKEMIEGAEVILKKAKGE